jgi:hypothetical protein
LTSGATVARCAVGVYDFKLLLFASMHHLHPEQAAERALGMWREAQWDNVVRRWSAPRCATAPAIWVRFPCARRAAVQPARPHPLRRMIDRWRHWPDLHRNVQEGTVASIATVATSFTTNQTTVPGAAGGPTDGSRASTSARLGTG